MGLLHAQGIPERCFQSRFRQASVGHAQADRQAIAANVHGAAHPIHQPAPASAAMLPALFVLAQSNGSGAADQADARLPGGKGAGQGCALITGHQHRLKPQGLAG